jgi:subtilisin family serine protease
MNAAAETDVPLPFPGATGRGVRVAVIDSGVNLRHPHICAPTRGVLLDPAKPGDEADDTLGHGTAVMAAIQEKAPAAEYYAVKLFGATLRTNVKHLIQALEWAIEQRMDVVNLSLGTPNPEHRRELQTLVERAAQAGVVLISARHTGSQPAYPGSLEGVVSVDVDWNLPRHCFRAHSIDGQLCFYASGYPRTLPGTPPSRNLNGISFAVANMTGFAVRACDGLTDRTFCRIRESLASAATWSPNS